jgi:hypothetical protein
VLDGRSASAAMLPLVVLTAFTAVFVVIAIRRLRPEDTKVGWT